MTEDSKWQAISLHDGNNTFEVDGDDYDSAASNALEQLGWSLSPPDEPLDPWREEDKKYPRVDWRRHVAEDATVLGYWDWVKHRKESDKNE